MAAENKKQNFSAADSSVIAGSPHEDFARRLEMAMDATRADLPPKFKGRNEELARRIRERFGVPVTPETVSKWSKGTAYPRVKRRAALASVLGVDLAWLHLGAGGSEPIPRSASSTVGIELPTRATAKRHQQPVRWSTARHLALAMAEFSGARILDVPDAGDVHFTAAVGGGVVLAIHAVLGERVIAGWRVKVPRSADTTYVMGILSKTPTAFTAVELFWDDLERVGTVEGDMLVVEISEDLRTGDVAWTQIEDFVRRPHL